MRTLKYAILGLINRHDMTGYDITKEFNAELANFWNAKHSQIYPELKKLVEEGLISFDVVVTGDVLEKKLYSITEKGKSELQRWLIKDEPLEPTPKDKFRLKMYFCDELPIDKMTSLIKSQLEKRSLKHKFLVERLQEYQEIPAAGTDRFGDYIVIEGAVMRENTYIEWLTKILGYLTKS